MLLEKDKMLSNKRMLLQFSTNIPNQLTDSLNLFDWFEDTSMSSGNDTINSIIKNFVFHQSIKKIKKKFKIKSELSINHVSSETIKRIINECV